MAARAVRCLVGLVFLGLLLAMAVPAGATPGERWLAFGGTGAPAEPSLTVLGADASAVNLKADLRGAMADDLKIGDQVYSRLYGPGYGHAAAVGRPDLPVLRQDVEVPFGAWVSLEIVQAEYTDRPLADLGLYPIYPLQPPVPKMPSAAENAPFQIDRDFYSHGSLYPATPAALGETYVVRGHRVQPVEVWPVAYDPSAGTVRLYASVTFRLVLSGSDIASTQALAERYASPAFEARLSQQILNYNQSRPAVQFVPNTPVGYLIVVADAYYDAMAPFVSLKQNRGFEVTMTKMSQIPGGESNTDIKAYIQNAYDTWPTPPSYVLLVGDTNTVPTWTGPTIGTSTDLYYGTMDGQNDWHPDMGRGRFPVRSTVQTTNMVDKYLAYAGLSGQEPWVKKAAFPATCDNYAVAEGTHNYVINNYTLPNGYTGIFPNNPQPGGDKLYCVTYGATHQDLVNAFNDGRWAIIYSGHGSYSGWEMSFVPSDIVNLTSFGTFPFVASHACLSGDFGQTEVFGETWVLQQNKGALVYWGSSTYSYWDEDDVLERGMFDSLYAPGLPHANVTQMTDDGLARVEEAYPSSARYYRETYNVLGDPAVKIFLEPEEPTFSLSVDPGQFEVCTSGSVDSTATIGSIMGYNGTVSLGTLPPPVGITATFDPDSAPAPYTSQMTLDVAPGTPAGDYDVVVQATDNIKVLDASVGLRLVTGAPAAPVLVSPADGAGDQPFAPAFDWDSVPWASTYHLQLDRSPLFTAPLVDVTGLLDSSYTVGSPLDGGLCYWWRAQGDNACGTGSWATPFHFSTVALEVGFYDDMESGSGQWAHQAAQGVDHWAVSTADSHSPTHSWFVPDDSVVTDTRLWNATAVPVGNGSTLTFWHRYQFEGTSYDGSVLEASVDGGQSWTDLGPYITANGYNGTISSGYSNPLAGRQAWTDDLTNWTEVEVNLSAFAGQSVKIRWRLGCDSSVSDTGWYIDDVQITSPLPPNPVPTRVTITPNSGSPFQATPAQIAGSGFVETPSVRLGDTWLLDVVQVSPTLLTAVVPAGMAAGTYDLVLYNGDCQQVTLPDAFTVTPSTNTMQVRAIKMQAKDRGAGKYVVISSTRIVDQAHVVVPGATVSAEWTLPDGLHQSQQGVTNANGLAAFRLKTMQTGEFQICVINVTKAGYVYDPNQNHVTCRMVTIP